jgi:hypothetical protein
VSKPFAESRPGMPCWRSSPWLTSVGTLWMARTWDADGASLYGSVSRPLGAGTCGWCGRRIRSRPQPATAGPSAAVRGSVISYGRVACGWGGCGCGCGRGCSLALSCGVAAACSTFFPRRAWVAAPANQRPRFRQHQLFPNMQPPWAVFHPLVSSLPLGHTNSRCPCHWYTASLGVHSKPVPVIHSALHRSIPPTTGLTMAGHESLQRAVDCLSCGSRCYLTFDPRHDYTGVLS